MMFHSTQTVIPVANPHPAKTKLSTFFTDAYLFLLHCVHVLMAPIPHPWARYYRRVAVVEGCVVMPHSALSFIIGGLFAFAEFKSQGQPGFPFETHLNLVRFSIACLLMFGLACMVELVVSATGLHRTCGLAVIARLGKIGFLCVLVISLACLLYF